MTLPPKPGSKSRSSTDTATGKAAQRARNKEAGSITRAGSSGKAKAIAKYPKRSWEELTHGDAVTHVADIAGKISHSQIGGNGYMTSTINTPMEFAHDLLEAHQRCADGLVYIRVYHVSVEDYLGELAEGDDDGEE